jgi:hypothetical protein
MLALAIIHDVVDHAVHLLMVQGLHIDPAHVTVDTNHRWQACGQVQIGGFVLDAESQQLGNVHGVLFG